MFSGRLLNIYTYMMVKRQNLLVLISLFVNPEHPEKTGRNAKNSSVQALHTDTYTNRQGTYTHTHTHTDHADSPLTHPHRSNTPSPITHSETHTHTLGRFHR